MGRPVTQEDHDRVRELHARGLSRNAIAEAMGRSGRTVSRIAARLGLTFERSDQVRAATEARRIDAAARRAQLQVDALAAAQRCVDQLSEAAIVYSFGGRDNDYNQVTLPEPPARDKRDLATAAQALTTMAIRLAEYDRDTGVDSARSMLGELGRALGAAAAALADQQGDG